RLDKVRPEVTAFPEHSFREWNIPRAHVEQAPSRFTNGLNVSTAAAGPDPPMFAIGVPVQGSFACDRDVLLAVGVDERRIIHALSALPSRGYQRKIARAVADEAQRGTSGYVQIDVALEMNRGCGVNTAR